MSEKEPMYFWAIWRCSVGYIFGHASDENDAMELLKDNIGDGEVGYVLQSVAEVKIVKRSEVVVTK